MNHLAEILSLGIWYALQLYLLGACGYVISSAVIFSVFSRRIQRQFTHPECDYPANCQTHFVLLIPAHNEARPLPALLDSIRGLHYPPDLFRTVVVADNCTDQTAFLAHQAKVTCFERNTNHPSDKTQALRYAVEQLTQRADFPAFSGLVICVIDADCVLDKNYLRELDKHYAQPGAAPVVQSYRSVSNAFDSNVTVLDAAAEAMRQWVLSGTRMFLGQDTFIFGLGCSMRAPVFADLMALPVTSLAEDKEWKVYLTQRRMHVAYCPTARLSYEVVRDADAFRQQRARWLAGYFQSLRTYGPRMLWRGLRGANLAQLDLALDLLQPPRSVLLAAAAFFGLLAVCYAPLSLVSGWVWLSILAAFWLYGALGLRLIGARPRHYLLLFSGFRLVGTVLHACLRIGLGRGVGAWQATARASRVS